MREKIVLAFIVIVAVFLRFYSLSTIPVSLSHDEVAIGYNAYSILQTGKDEYGNAFPMLFRSFEDYKLPGYVYSTVVSEKIFGLSEFSVRFPSAFFGVLTVLFMYLFVKTLFSISEKEKKSSHSEHIALIAAFFLAISPWHVNFSRAAFEANGSLLFIVAGAYCLLKGFFRPRYYIFSAVLFVLAMYFYYTARILIPTLIICYALSYRKEIIVQKRYLLLSLVTGLLLLLPILPFMFSSGLSRVNQVSIFNDKKVTNPYTQALARNVNIVSKIVYNRRMAYLQEFSDNYLKNFAPDFYFVNGTGPMGLLYLWEAPFFLFGLYSVATRREKWKWLLLTWFFSVPLVGGFTMGQPNALRTLANVPMAALFSSLGIYLLFLRFKGLIRNIAVISLSVIGIFFFIRFLFLYFDYNPPLVAPNWGDGHKQLASYLKDNGKNYKDVYVTGEHWRPYIYMLFYISYDPNLYHKNGTLDGFSNFHFARAVWDRGERSILGEQNLSLFVKGKTLFILSQNDLTLQNNLKQDNKVLYTLRIVKQIDGVLAKGVFYAAEIQ